MHRTAKRGTGPAARWPRLGREKGRGSPVAGRPYFLCLSSHNLLGAVAQYDSPARHWAKITRRQEQKKKSPGEFLRGIFAAIRMGNLVCCGSVKNRCSKVAGEAIGFPAHKAGESMETAACRQWIYSNSKPHTLTVSCSLTPFSSSFSNRPAFRKARSKYIRDS